MLTDKILPAVNVLWQWEVILLSHQVQNNCSSRKTFDSRYFSSLWRCKASLWKCHPQLERTTVSVHAFVVKAAPETPLTRNRLDPSNLQMNYLFVFALQASNFLQENMLGLQSLPGESELEQLRENKRIEVMISSWNSASANFRLVKENVWRCSCVVSNRRGGTWISSGKEFESEWDKTVCTVLEIIVSRVKWSLGTWCTCFIHTILWNSWIFRFNAE